MADRNKKAEAAIKNFGEDLEGRTALYPAAASGSSIAEQTTLALIDQGADAGFDTMMAKRRCITLPGLPLFMLTKQCVPSSIEG